MREGTPATTRQAQEERRGEKSDAAGALRSTGRRFVLVTEICSQVRACPRRSLPSMFPARGRRQLQKCNPPWWRATCLLHISLEVWCARMVPPVSDDNAAAGGWLHTYSSHFGSSRFRAWRGDWLAQTAVSRHGRAGASADTATHWNSLPTDHFVHVWQLARECLVCRTR